MRTLSFNGLRPLRCVGADFPWILAWIAAAAGIELLGRRSSSDVGDAVGVAVLSSLGLLTSFRHAKRPLGFVARIQEALRRVAARCASFSIHVGLDLRREPPLPERLPRLVTVPVAAILVGCGLAWLARGHLPGDVRAILMSSSCALYVALLTLLWSALVASTLVSFVFPLACLDEALNRSRRLAPARASLLVWAALGYLVAIVGVASVAPAWVPLVACIVAQAAFCVLSCRSNVATLLVAWRPASRAFAPAAFRWTVFTGAIQLGTLGIFLLLVLVARGDALGSGQVSTTPITSFLGLTLSWTFLGFRLVELGQLSTVVAGGWYRDPARRERPRVHVVGASEPALRCRADTALSAAGFAVLGRHARRRSTDVPIEVDAGSASAPAARNRSLRVCDAELDEPALHARLRRRSEVLCRRALRKGLERIFRAAARQSFEKGSGFWVAPHQWFITHLTRDVDEGVLGHVGPSYASVIPIAARRHLHQVLGALELDLLFVEDGVRFSALKAVLAMLFEHYDVYGGARLADERRFQGLPGIRVLLHDYVLEEPLVARGYPEPDYEDLGRARILHVFRDRGDGRDETPTPRDVDSLPAPELVHA